MLRHFARIDFGTTGKIAGVDGIRVLALSNVRDKHLLRDLESRLIDPVAA
jgi:hypothetical protein